MKRIPIIVLLSVLGFSSIGSVSDAKRRSERRRAVAVPSGKVEIHCPTPLNDITDCMHLDPDTGCGPALDPNLNEQKNIRSKGGASEAMTLQDLKDLPDPVPGFEIGDDRQPLKDLGEGKKITIMAYALVARKGGTESCNCGLGQAKDTDNHIVLVEEETLALTRKATPAKPATATRKALRARTARENTLDVRERQSVTAEFTPRVRLDHPKLAGARLQSLIEATPKKALLVRVTGLLMFDSQHSLESHLKRVNNWEIHPVLKMESCPTGESCTESSDNWMDLEN